MKGNIMQFSTKKPSGRASFPTILLSGIQGGGKTWAAVEATGLPDVGRAFVIEIGEDKANEYGAVPGADFEIIETDGTVGQLRAAIEWASQQPVEPGKYNMLVLDSMSRLWELLSDNAQQTANQRSSRKGRRVSEDGAQITMDLWNRATDAWNGIITQCRRFHGPVLLTARLDMVTLVDDNGQPTKFKDWKIRAQKNLAYDCDVVLQAREVRRWTMTKIATAAEALRLPPGGEMTFNEFTVGHLLTGMGVTPESDGSHYVEPRANGELGDDQQQQRPAQQQQAQQPRQQLPALPDNPEATIQQLEAAGDVGRLQELWRVANAHNRLDIRKLAEEAGKRVSQGDAERLAGEQLGATPADPVAATQEHIRDAQDRAAERPQSETLPLEDAMGSM